MAIIPANLQRLLRSVRPGLVALIFLGGFIAWFGWQLSQQWFDRPLPASAVQAQQLKVNSSKLKTLQDQLQNYHQPEIIGSPKSNPFSLGG